MHIETEFFFGHVCIHNVHLKNVFYVSTRQNKITKLPFLKISNTNRNNNVFTFYFMYVY